MGLLWGSFVNVLIYRMPRGKNIAWPGSHCPTCGAPVNAYDNIPVLSYLILGGKTRCCKKTLSARYPIVELICGAWGFVVARGIADAGPRDLSLGLVVARDAGYLAFGLILIAQAFIDLDFMILMPSLNVLLGVLGFATVPLRGLGWQDAVAGTLAIPVGLWLFAKFYAWVRKREGIGGGDFHLLLGLGPWIGLSGSLFVLFAGAIQSVVAALVIRLTLGKLPLPVGVQEELAELRAAADAGDEEAKQALAEDPVAHADEEGFGSAALPLGPFLVFGALEWIMFRDLVVGTAEGWLSP